MSGPTLLPMVGRDQELALLLERWAQAEAGEGQGVLLVGEAGIGKSRISRALLDAVAAEPHVRVRYQCSPYHADSALWPVVQQLSHAAGFGADDAVEAKLDKLEALLDRASGRDAAPLIAELLGLDGTAVMASSVSPRRCSGRGPSRRWSSSCSGSPPAASPGGAGGRALDRSDHARADRAVPGPDRRGPVLILLTSRPDNQPSLAAHPHVTRLTLNRLSRAGVEAIVARLGGDQLPSKTIAAIIARTDGVPLFVEELTKAVLETGETAIPASLHDSLMARLDRLPEVKEIAQTAACIGREFDYALLAAIADMPEPGLAIALDRLTAAELIFRRGNPPEALYTFKHALVRDAAYESLLRQRRRQVHARIATTLLQNCSQTGSVPDDIVATHLLAAERLREALPHLLAAAKTAAN